MKQGRIKFAYNRQWPRIQGKWKGRTIGGGGRGVFTLWRTRGVFVGEEQPQLEHAILPGSALLARNAGLPLHQIKRPVGSLDGFGIEALGVSVARVGGAHGVVGAAGDGAGGVGGAQGEVRRDGPCARVCALRRGGCGRAPSSSSFSIGRSVVAEEADSQRKRDGKCLVVNI